MKCTYKEQEKCEVEKRGCIGCYYSSEYNLVERKDFKKMIDYKKEYERLKKIYEPKEIIKRGDIVFVPMDKQNIENVDFAEYSRPYLIISNNAGNFHSNICIGVPLTSKLKKISQPTHLRISYKDSVILCEHIKTLDQRKIKKINYHIFDEEMKKVDECLKISLGLN